MPALRALFDSPGFQSRVSDAYCEMIKAHSVRGIQELSDYLDETGHNVHVTDNQLTITSKLSRNPMGSRIILDMVSPHAWRPLRNVAKAVYQAQWHIAYYFDIEHMSYLKREMDNDDAIVDQGSESAQDRRLG